MKSKFKENLYNFAKTCFFLCRFPVYPLTKFIQKHIPNARMVEEIGSDIVFILPTDDSKDIAMKQFEQLFNELDQNLKKLRISTYGLSDTTLEEVLSLFIVFYFK